MKIVYSKTNKFHIGKIVLANGVNEVSKEDWEIIKEHPQVKYFIKEGIISIKNVAAAQEAPDSGPSPDPSAEDGSNDDDSNKGVEVKDMNVKELTAYVATLTSIEDLESLLAIEESNENRKGAKKVIKAQIKTLKEINNV